MLTPKATVLRNERTGEWEQHVIDIDTQRRNNCVAGALEWLSDRRRTFNEVATILAEFGNHIARRCDPWSTRDQPDSNEQVSNASAWLISTGAASLPKSDHEFALLLVAYANHIARQYDPTVIDEISRERRYFLDSLLDLAIEEVAGLGPCVRQKGRE